MGKFIKVLLFIGYILYAFKLVDDKARGGGIIDAIISLVVAGFFGCGIFHILWIWKGDENTSPTSNNSESKQGRYDKLKENNAQQNNSRTTSLDANNLVMADEAEQHFDKGEINSDLGNYYEAIDDYSKAIELNSNRDQYYFKRAMAMKHRARELKNYQMDVNWYPTSGYQRIMRDDRFDYYRKFDDGTVPPYCREEILSDINRAIALNPSFKYYSSRAVFTGSMQDYAEAINLNPQDVKLYFNRGYQRYCDNDKEGAIADYSKAISLNPREARYYNNRAFAKESLNDYEGAKRDFDHAYRLNPSIYGDDHPNNIAPWERQFGSFGFFNIE